MADIKTQIDKRAQELRRVRDELRVQAHLAKADARDAWAKLETKWQSFEEKARDLTSTTGETTGKVADRARDLLKEIEEGYERLKRQVS